MRLLRFETDGRVRLGALTDGRAVPLDALSGDYPTIRAILLGGANALERIDAFVKSGAASLELSQVRLLAPIERPGKYLAIGMNYAKHLEEADKLGVARSKHQTWFNKQTTCLNDPFGDIDPGVTEKLDYEVELGVVIGKTAKAVSEADAPRHVFGYFVANDVSARDWQFHSQTFTMGKSFDTHGPIGPWADWPMDRHRRRGGRSPQSRLDVSG
jgi:2-keto-4-pentenoate hydratase/2-oxohepta-3-ene-1,7-dioic acid hydratase in catechol pathway